MRNCGLLYSFSLSLEGKVLNAVKQMRWMRFCSISFIDYLESSTSSDLFGSSGAE